MLLLKMFLIYVMIFITFEKGDNVIEEDDIPVLTEKITLENYSFPRISKKDIFSYFSVVLLLSNTIFEEQEFKNIEAKNLVSETLSSINCFPDDRVIKYLQNRIPDIKIILNSLIKEDSGHSYCKIEDGKVSYYKITLLDEFTTKTRGIFAHELGHVLYGEHQNNDSFLYNEFVPLFLEYLSFFPDEELFFTYRLQLEKNNANYFLDKIYNFLDEPSDEDYQSLAELIVIMLSYFKSLNVLFQVIDRLKINEDLVLDLVDKLSFGEITMDEFFSLLRIEKDNYVFFYEMIEKYEKKEMFSFLKKKK